MCLNIATAAIDVDWDEDNVVILNDDNFSDLVYRDQENWGQLWLVFFYEDNQS